MSTVMTPGSRADRIREMEETWGNARCPANVGELDRLLSGLGGAALIAAALTRPRWQSAALAGVGGAFVARGITGHSYLYDALGISTAKMTVCGDVHRGIKIQRSFTINRSPQECYDFWRRFENLPRFMEHLVSVTQLDSGRSRWVARGPMGRSVSWEAEIINDVPGEMISWRSVKDSDVDNAGSVWFRPAPAGRGTEVTVELNYEPPAGVAGAAIAWLFGENPSRQVTEDLRHFKQIMEAGEIPTVHGQTSCRH